MYDERRFCATYLARIHSSASSPDVSCRILIVIWFSRKISAYITPTGEVLHSKTTAIQVLDPNSWKRAWISGFWFLQFTAMWSTLHSTSHRGGLQKAESMVFHGLGPRTCTANRFAVFQLFHLLAQSELKFCGKTTLCHRPLAKKI